MLWWVWNPSLSLYHYHLLQHDWFCWAITIYHGEGYGRHNSSVDNNLHTAAICPDVVRTSGALLQRVTLLVTHSAFSSAREGLLPIWTMISEHGELFPAPSWRFIRTGKNDPSLPPLVSNLSVESDTASISHQPRSFSWHPSGGLWEYSLGWNEPNTTAQRGKVNPHTFTCRTSKNRNFIRIFWSLSNQTNKKISYQIKCIFPAYLTLQHAGGNFRK